MKALTVKQPWASLIVAGIKDIENRTWATKYRGPLLIHSASKMAVHEFTHEQSTKISEHYFDYDMPFSAIIGQVDVVDCVINHPSVWAEKTDGVLVGNKFFRKDETKVVWNWVLANPVQFDEPILNVKGKLSLWEWEGKL